MSLQYKFLDLDGEQFLTVYAPGQPPRLASNETHSNFDELVRLARSGDESVIELFDTEGALRKAFADVVEGRVAIRGGVVYFDDDAMDNAITEAILRFHEDGENFSPLVKFMENVMANPQVESREQFYRYLQAYNLPIDDDGCVVLYKGVYANADGAFYSTHAGHAFVNGKEYKGVKVPNRVGDVVTMPRSEVDFDPNAACSSGLHSGTHGYARSYGDTLMYIRVNPRDVVSVPHDVSSQKVRVCRYEVVGFADRDAEYAKARWAPKVEDSGKVDTRRNHLNQKRDAKGHFIKMK
jgi:hypothetical protein